MHSLLGPATNKAPSCARRTHATPASHPPCSVEKPFLKPVVLVGPDTGERAALLARLASEFPDVFAFPRAHTTWSLEEERRAHVAADGGC